MPVPAIAIGFLGELEKAELELLHWGVVDGAFEESEVEQRAQAFLDQRQAQGQDSDFVDGWQLAEAAAGCAFALASPGDAQIPYANGGSCSVVRSTSTDLSRRTESGVEIIPYSGCGLSPSGAPSTLSREGSEC